MNWYKEIKESETHSYSTVMLRIKGELKKDIQNTISSIDDIDLAEDGKEDDIHVTVLYGLHTEDAEDVRDVIDKIKPFSISLGKISKFTSSDEYDVLKVEVEGKELVNANGELRNLPYTSTHAGYKAHLTLAYVKKGKCSNLVGDERFLGKKFLVEELIFSSKNEDKTTIKLSK